jgi:erythromycin esterase-like protein
MTRSKLEKIYLAKKQEKNDLKVKIFRQLYQADTFNESAFEADRAKLEALNDELADLSRDLYGRDVNAFSIFNGRISA